jgi:lipopolysaccharide export LptBFGC system permease protein LptF
MVFTLQRYVFRELLKIFILATVGLTLILSLGGILQPIQEYGVGPQQVVHILLYFMPITLTFVLPMAALFASALAYGRLASDNELDACRASGIGMVTLVYPGLILAILVAIANLVLSFHVMPYFVHLAERSLKADAKQILFRNIQRRGYYELPTEHPYFVYADYANPATDTLAGIVAVQAKDDIIRRIVTSDRTVLRFNPNDRFNEVQLATYNSKEMGAATNDVWVDIGSANITQEFGSMLGDDIKFKRINEMKQIRADLMRFDPIARTARTAYAQLTTELLAEDISTTLRRPTAGVFELRGLPNTVRFSATSCVLEDELTISLIGPVVVDEYDTQSGLRLRRLECNRAVIRIPEDVDTDEIALLASNARVQETGVLMVRDIIQGLRLPQATRKRLGARPILQAVAPETSKAILRGSPSSALARLQREIAKETRSTLVDITAEINSRLVFGIGCVPMILIGIGIGIIKRGGHLLSAFGASCIPAAVLIVGIISGKHLTENAGAQGLSGILIMWGGLGFLTLLAVVIYGKLIRH